MDTLVKADIFFFISSIAVVIVTIAVVVIVYYFIKVGKELTRVTTLIEAKIGSTETEVKEIIEDIQGSFLYNFFIRKRKRKNKQ